MKIDNNKKILFYKILLVLLLILAIIIVILIARKHSERKIFEKKNKEIVQEFKNAIEENNFIEKDNLDNTLKEEKIIEFEGHKVIGIIKIPKINLEYPIVDETTQATMKATISRYWGKEINSFGNVSLAGHNNYDGTMFGKNKKLKIGDIIELTDLLNNTIQYEIYDIFSTHPDDVSILKTTNNEIREVTLITCTNGRKERLIIKAHEKIN